MWSSKNKHFSKHEMINDCFGDLVGRRANGQSTTFGMLPTNERWRVERKAVSHMLFYKEKLRIMIGVIKQHIQL